MKSKLAKRKRAARLLACQVLYGLSFPEGGSEANLSRSFHIAQESEGEGMADEEFARELVEGARRNLTALDDSIGHFSKRKRQRLGKIEATLLRMALYEMNYMETPPRVVISETLDMADQFGCSAAKDFLNGVLHAALMKKAETSGN